MSLVTSRFIDYHEIALIRGLAPDKRPEYAASRHVILPAYIDQFLRFERQLDYMITSNEIL
jgi:hypothetical protein